MSGNPVHIRDSDGNALKSTRGALNINSALTLDPTNLSTGAKQDTIITSLGNLKTDLDKLAGAVDGTTTKRIVVILCGTRGDGTVTPLKCDANGQLLTTTGA